MLAVAEANAVKATRVKRRSAALSTELLLNELEIRPHTVPVAADVLEEVFRCQHSVPSALRLRQLFLVLAQEDGHLQYVANELQREKQGQSVMLQPRRIRSCRQRAAPVSPAMSLSAQREPNSKP